MMKVKRFEYRRNSQGIYDSLTGDIYSGNMATCQLLNDVNDRADRNAELLDVDCTAQKIYVDKVQMILDKYEIDSLEKLDLVLMQQRVW